MRLIHILKKNQQKKKKYKFIQLPTFKDFLIAKKTIHECDSLLKDDKVVDKLIYFFDGMTFVSRTNKGLFQEFIKILAI